MAPLLEPTPVLLLLTAVLAGCGSDGAGEETSNLPPGEYGLVCTVGNHRDLGMVGSLTVR